MHTIMWAGIQTIETPDTPGEIYFFIQNVNTFCFANIGADATLSTGCLVQGYFKK
jgi:hypothetical protein